MPAVQIAPTLVAVAALVFSACGSHSEKASLPGASTSTAARGVRVAKPATRVETELARATGSIRAKNEATLAARTTAQIKRIRVAVGDRVRAGAPLVEMDSANAEIALENALASERLAAASLAEAERDLARNQALLEGGSISAAALDKVTTAKELAAARLDNAKAAVRAARQALSDATLVAPFAGVITAKHHNVGDTVTLMPVSPILTLADVDHLEARLALPEAIESFAKVGQDVQGELSPSGQRFTARVRVKNSVVDPASRTIEVLADVIKMDGPPIRPGSLAHVDFSDLAQRDGMFLPTTAIRTEGGAAYLFVVNNGRAERRAVEVAPLHPGTVSVKSGIDPQAEVVLDPGTLTSGDTVIAIPN